MNKSLETIVLKQADLYMKNKTCIKNKYGNKDIYKNEIQEQIEKGHNVVIQNDEDLYIYFNKNLANDFIERLNNPTAREIEYSPIYKMHKAGKVKIIS